MVGFMRFFMLALLAFASSAIAQSADPTRPPAAWLIPADSVAVGAGGSDSLRLQSVKIPLGGKPVAVIGGKTVVLGERFGDATLVGLTEREAVLKGADGVVHLYLTPDVEKQMIVTPKSSKAGKTGYVKDVP